MVLYLHIGTEKTGTTSVQNFFAAHREVLQKHGILYPRSVGRENHRALAVLAQNRTGTALWEKLGIRDTGEFVRFRQEVEVSLADELAAGGAPKTIMSNEHCSSRLRSDAEVEALRRFLAQFFDEIYVVVYLRRQDDFVVSTYSTEVRLGDTEPLAFPKDKVISSRYDYWELLSRWARVFGRDRVICRKFEQSGLVAGNVIDDVLRATGIGSIPGCDTNLSRNVSLDAECLEFLRLMNRHADPSWKTRRFIEALEASSTGPMLELPDDLRLALMQRLRDSNARVAREYFGGELCDSDDPLFKPRSDNRPRVQDGRLDAGKAVALAAKLFSAAERLADNPRRKRKRQS